MFFLQDQFLSLKEKYQKVTADSSQMSQNLKSHSQDIKKLKNHLKVLSFKTQEEEAKKATAKNQKEKSLILDRIKAIEQEKQKALQINRQLTNKSNELLKAYKNQEQTIQQLNTCLSKLTKQHRQARQSLQNLNTKEIQKKHTLILQLRKKFILSTKAHKEELNSFHKTHKEELSKLNSTNLNKLHNLKSTHKEELSKLNSTHLNKLHNLKTQLEKAHNQNNHIVSELKTKHENTNNFLNARAKKPSLKSKPRTHKFKN